MVTMNAYLNEDTRAGWLRWFATEHWVSMIPNTVEFPARIVNRTAKNTTPFIAVSPSCPVRLGKILADRLAVGKPMYPTVIGEPPRGVKPQQMVNHLYKTGLWIAEDALVDKTKRSLLVRLSQCIVEKNGLFQHQRGIFDRLLSGAYPGVRFVGPAVRI